MAKGRTAGGRIRKGYKLTRGGSVVKKSGSTRRRKSGGGRKRRGLFG
jgi:hypothetical protein